MKTIENYKELKDFNYISKFFIKTREYSDRDTFRVFCNYTHSLISGTPHHSPSYVTVTKFYTNQSYSDPEPLTNLSLPLSLQFLLKIQKSQLLFRRRPHLEFRSFYFVSCLCFLFSILLFNFSNSTVVL